jgi:hypothetical protein
MLGDKMSAIDEALAFGVRVTIMLIRMMVSLGWKLGTGIFYYLGKRVQPSPETKLVAPKTTYELGQVIEAQPCPECGTANEQGAVVCYACGTDLVTPKAQASSGQDWGEWLTSPIFTILAGFLGIVFICLACQACNFLLTGH